MLCDNLGPKCKSVPGGLWLDIPAKYAVTILRERGWQHLRIPSGIAVRKDGRTFALEPFDGVATMLREI